MYTVEKELKFDTAHRLLGYDGKCHNVHGHTYKAIFCIQTKEVNQMGMVKDFNEFKVIQKRLDDNRDHSYIFGEGDEVGVFLTDRGYRTYNMIVNPTAENMAKYLFNQFSYLGVNKVMVYETPTSLAIFKEDE